MSQITDYFSKKGKFGSFLITIEYGQLILLASSSRRKTQTCLSGLKFVFLLSTMSQTRFTGLALLHIHYNMDIDFDEMIRRFARLHPRRMQLANILFDRLQKPAEYGGREWTLKVRTQIKKSISKSNNSKLKVDS